MSNEGFNPAPGIINAETTCDLQGKETDGLEEGCLGFVRIGVEGRAGFYHYWRLTFLTPPLAVDGKYVLSAYNSAPPLQQDGATPCPALPAGTSAHQPGPARWILLNITEPVFH